MLMALNYVNMCSFFSLFFFFHHERQGPFYDMNDGYVVLRNEKLYNKSRLKQTYKETKR